ncbi:MAG: transporter [Gemmatimonadetes bacterium]|nr:transporter [Gemmatimonadota bacterium]
MATPSSRRAGRSRLAETFGSLPAGDGDAGHHVDGGFTFLVRDNLQLDLSFGRGIAGASDWFVGAGVSVRLPR